MQTVISTDPATTPTVGDLHQNGERIPSFEDWAMSIRMQSWMYGHRLTKPSEI
jgi:hypothetical protein